MFGNAPQILPTCCWVRVLAQNPRSVAGHKRRGCTGATKMAWHVSDHGSSSHELGEHETGEVVVRELQQWASRHLTVIVCDVPSSLGIPSNNSFRQIQRVEMATAHCVPGVLGNAGVVRWQLSFISHGFPWVANSTLDSAADGKPPRSH